MLLSADCWPFESHCSFLSLFQKPPDGDRLPEEERAFRLSLEVMADLYASAVGTTVFQLKEIPPRPPAFDGALCLFGLEDAADMTTIRAAFEPFGVVGAVAIGAMQGAPQGTAVVRFTTHAGALAAKKAGAPEGVCSGIDFLYNERSYDGRSGDVGGRDDDAGRGW